MKNGAVLVPSLRKSGTNTVGAAVTFLPLLLSASAAAFESLLCGQEPRQASADSCHLFHWHS